MYFIVKSIVLGIGLAMDAFSVSVVNGLKMPKMTLGNMVTVAGVFGLCQWIMPLLGWFAVHTMVQLFSSFSTFIPWIAFILLLYIGVSLIRESLKHEFDDVIVSLDHKRLFLQGIATSIDALSVGFTIATYSMFEAMLACILIGLVTFVLCFWGIQIGKRAGLHLADKAGIVGGIILICIGLEIFIQGVF